MKIPRPRFTIGFLLILVAGSAVLIALLEPYLNPPRAIMVVVGKPSINRGTLSPGAYRREVWVILNKGRAPLTIAPVAPSLDTGLSIWEGTNLVIAPGEKAEIQMTFVTPDDVGKRFSRLATLSTNDRDAPRIVLQVDAMTGIVESSSTPTGEVPVRVKP